MLIKVFQPAFFAREDTRTPMWFAMINLVVNVAGSIALFYGLRSAWASGRIPASRRDDGVGLDQRHPAVGRAEAARPFYTRQANGARAAACCCCRAW